MLPLKDYECLAFLQNSSGYSRLQGFSSCQPPGPPKRAGHADAEGCPEIKAVIEKYRALWVADDALLVPAPGR